MKIRETDVGQSLEVYGLYWAEYRSKIHRFHLVIPQKDYPGLVSLPESECELLDPSVDGLILIKNIRGGDTLIHPILRDEALLNSLIDHDAASMAEFLLLLKQFDGSD